MLLVARPVAASLAASRARRRLRPLHQPVLAKARRRQDVKEVKQLTPRPDRRARPRPARRDRRPSSSSSTNDGRYAKLLVQAGPAEGRRRASRCPSCSSSASSPTGKARNAPSAPAARTCALPRLPLQPRPRPGGARGSSAATCASSPRATRSHLEPVGKAKMYLVTKHDARGDAEEGRQAGRRREVRAALLQRHVTSSTTTAAAPEAALKVDEDKAT